jgi:uncharacterized protein
MEYDTAIHSLQCPKCHHGMEEITHQGIVIDRCTHCRGLWFDHDEVNQLKGVKDGHLVDSHADINCPHCGKEMEKTADPKQKHIWFEMCPEHGIFMDAGEFKDYKFESVLDRFRSLIKGDRNIVAP